MSVNPLAAFTPLILPVLFLPYMDVKVDSYLDAYLIDMRNGYVYAQIGSTRTSGEDYLTIYSDARDHLVAAPWDELVREASGAIAKVVAAQHAPGQ